jgi:hypothetical protein
MTIENVITGNAQSLLYHATQEIGWEETVSAAQQKLGASLWPLSGFARLPSAPAEAGR